MRKRWIPTTLLSTAVVVVVLAGAWFVLVPLTSWVAGPSVSTLEAKDQLAALGAVRGQLLTLLGGVGLAGGLVYTVRSFRLAREGQFTDRFTKAIGHLDSSDETVRAGGIRALDRIMADSPRDHDRVLESLTGFLRNHAAAAENALLADDVRAAITALRLRPVRREREPLDLSGIQLPGADLRKAQLIGADLRGCHLTGANLAGADLTGADLQRAHLSGAKLNGARFHDTELTAADLTGTDLTEVVGLTTAQFKLASIDTRTRLPTSVDHQP
jgi:hypothetical protein